MLVFPVIIHVHRIYLEINHLYRILHLSEPSMNWATLSEEPPGGKAKGLALRSPSGSSCIFWCSWGQRIRPLQSLEPKKTREEVVSPRCLEEHPRCQVGYEADSQPVTCRTFPLREGSTCRTLPTYFCIWDIPRTNHHKTTASRLKRSPYWKIASCSAEGQQGDSTVAHEEQSQGHDEASVMQGSRRIGPDQNLLSVEQSWVINIDTDWK